MKVKRVNSDRSRVDTVTVVEIERCPDGPGISPSGSLIRECLGSTRLDAAHMVAQRRLDTTGPLGPRARSLRGRMLVNQAWAPLIGAELRLVGGCEDMQRR